jgi:hypothetical protein
LAYGYNVVARWLIAPGGPKAAEVAQLTEEHRPTRPGYARCSMRCTMCTVTTTGTPTRTAACWWPDSRSVFTSSITEASRDPSGKEEMVGAHRRRGAMMRYWRMMTRQFLMTAERLRWSRRREVNGVSTGGSRGTRRALFRQWGSSG